MCAADTARCKHVDTCKVSDVHCGCDGCRTHAAACDYHGQVTTGNLGYACACATEHVDFFRGATYGHNAVDDCNRGRYTTVVADNAFHRFGGLHVLRIGHTVRDYRGFQRNHGAIVVKCKLHFGRDFEILTHATFLRNFYYFIFA